MSIAMGPDPGKNIQPGSRTTSPRAMNLDVTRNSPAPNSPASGIYTINCRLSARPRGDLVRSFGQVNALIYIVFLQSSVTCLTLRHVVAQVQHSILWPKQ